MQPRFNPLSATFLRVGLLLPLAVACSGAVDADLSEDGGDDDKADGGDGDDNPVFPGSSGGTSGSDDGSGDGDGDGDGDGTPQVYPPDCSLLTSAGYEVCSSGPTSCEVVFDNSAGCTAVCAAAGLTCAAAYDNQEGACAGDLSMPALSCDSGHESDFCVCEGAGSGPGPGSGGSLNNGSGGSVGSGSSSGSGGASPGSGGSGTGGSPAIGPKTCGCESSAGEFGTVNSTLTIKSGQTYDGGCKIFRANPSTLGDGSQDEGQQPIFELEDGATLKNVIIGASGADGIHIYGDATLQNVHWQDVGEDAMTIKESGTVHLDCGSAHKGSDKIFQINAYVDLYIANFTASGAGKFIRELGGSDFSIDVHIDHSDISDMSEVIFRTDSDDSHVTLTNSRYSDLGDGLFMFGSSVVNGNSSQSTVSNNQSY